MTVKDEKSTKMNEISFKKFEKFLPERRRIKKKRERERENCLNNIHLVRVLACPFFFF